MRAGIVLAVAALVIAGCSEAEPDSGAEGPPPGIARAADGEIEPVEGDGSIVSRYAGADWFAGTVPATAERAEETLEPVRVGIISTDDGPVAALPELHAGIDAAVSWVNDELGGVGGRPIETTFCGVDLSPEKSQQCARNLVDEGVVAVLAGVDVASGDAVAVLAENGIPWVGGIPINEAEMNSPYAFQFSGGSAGAFIAFGDHAVRELGAERVSIMYTNLPSVADGVDYGRTVLEAGGVEVTDVPFDLTTQDFAGVARKAAEGDPDAIMVGAADFACPKVMQALADLDAEATVYMVGACADAKWIDQVGPDAVAGTIFNVEGLLEQSATTSADTELYNEVMARYAPDTTPRGAATVAFRGAMNLWAVMTGLGPEQLDADAIVEAFRTTHDHPSFDGHAFTCDGEQIPGLRALCAPQQVLIRSEGGADFTQVTDGWIDVAEVIADAA